MSETQLTVSSLASKIDSATLKLGQLADFAEFVQESSDNYGDIDERLSAALIMIQEESARMYKTFSDLDDKLCEVTHRGKTR